MLALAVAVMLVMAVLVIPASATSDFWVSRFKGFTQTSINSYQSGYAAAVQSILLGHSSSSSYIAKAGGVDGSFGTGTKNAVIAFQNSQGLGADGIVGTNTWGRMAELMGEYVSGSTTNLAMGSRTAITIIYQNSVYNYYYRTTGGSLGSVFRTSY